jgi:glycosyltransferase involved in cell wall biosynthesis
LTKFSVITVTFNDAKNLKKTVGSVTNQNTDDYEHVIIDKYSNDNTDEIIKKNKNQHIKFFKVNDRGIYDAMNIGIKKSIGEFIIFLNSGDEFYDTIIKKSNAKIFYGSCFLKEKKKN